jgi:ABC-2 type transport system permease protein
MSIIGTGVKRIMRFREWDSLKMFSKRELIIWLSYKMNALMWVLDTLFTTIIFFTLSLVTRGSDISFFPYGSNYVSFVVLGLFVHFISYTNLGDPFPRVSRIYWGGTMDLYMLSPLSYFTPMLGIMFRGVIDDYPRSILALLFGWLFFGAVFTFSSPFLLLIILILILLSTFGIGMISASSFYLFDFKQQVEPVKFIFQDVIIALTAGYYYPITVLPYPLQVLGGLIPHTYALDALRRLMIPGGDALTPVLPLQLALSGLSPVTLDILVLAVMSAVFLPLGWFMYVKGIEKARREGTLTRWQ